MRLRGEPGFVKVLECGLVRHFGGNGSANNLQEHAGADGIVGTANFISPEAIAAPTTPIHGVTSIPLASLPTTS